jgi:hypothetical protein
MKPELQKKLYEKYPKIFAQKDLPMTTTCMCWGIDCGDGWWWLIYNLCDSIQRYLDSKNDGIRIRNKARQKGKEYLKGTKPEEEWQVETVQIKEKFGGLRFYIDGGDDTIYGMIDFAEHLSYKICENCGVIEDVKVRSDGWVRTLCDKCEKEHNKKREGIK